MTLQEFHLKNYKMSVGQVRIMSSGKIPMGNLLNLRKTLKHGEVLNKREVYKLTAM